MPANDVELGICEQSLNMEEGTKLGLHSTIVITRLRDYFRAAEWSPYSACPGIYCKSCAGVSYGSFGTMNCDESRLSIFKFTAASHNLFNPKLLCVDDAPRARRVGFTNIKTFSARQLHIQD